MDGTKRMEAVMTVRSGDRVTVVLADAVARVAAGTEPGTPQFRQALHDAVAATKELPGTHGVFTFRPNDPYGLDKRAAVVIRLDKGQWKLVP